MTVHSENPTLNTKRNHSNSRSPSPIPIMSELNSSTTKLNHKERRSSMSTSASVDTHDRGLSTQRSHPTLSSRKPIEIGDEMGSDGSFSVLPSTAESSALNIPRLANDKRNNDFHNLFRSVPDHERLLDDYGCALQREILVQGRIYISERHLCFNANIFGWITNLVIAFDDIEDIEKKCTAIIIPNAILISTSTSKHFLASFLSRDQAYDQMVELWKASQQSHLEREDKEEMTEYSEDDYSGSSFYSDSEEEDMIDPCPEQGDINTRQTSLASLPVPKHLSAAAEAARRRAVSEAGVRPSVHEFIKKNSDNSRSTPTLQHITSENAGVIASSGDKEQSKDVTECDCHKSTGHYPIVVMDNKYNTTIDVIYNLLYNSPFMHTFLSEIEKSTDIQIGQWTKSNEQYSRESSYIKYLGSTIGPKSTKCYLKEDILHLDKTDYISQLTVTQTPDVPSGGSFTVKTKTCITWNGIQQVRVLVTVLVDFTKSSWLRSAIEKASIDGQQQYYKNLDAAVRNYLDKHAGGKKKGNKRKHRHRREREQPKIDISTDSSSHRMNDLLNGVIEWLLNMTFPNLSQLTIVCMTVMVLTNFYIAYKMALVDQQLTHLGHSDKHTVRNDDSLWNLLNKLDPDTNDIPSYPINTNSNDVTEEAIDFTESTKIKLDKQMAQLERMIRKAGKSMEHVNIVVQEQKKKIDYGINV